MSDKTRKKGKVMLNAPKRFTFWASVGLFVVGMIAALNLLQPYIPWQAGVIALTVGYILFVLGNILKGF